MKQVSKSPTSKNNILVNNSPNEKSFSNNNIKSDKVRIIVRIRPVLFNEEPNEFLVLQDPTTIKITRPDFNTIIMKFDEIIDQDGRQSQVFEMTSDAVQYFLQGNNYTIFAYGQTGAGKTYTVIGNYIEINKNTSKMLDSLKGENRGLLPRILECIFILLAKQRKIAIKLSISFYEIYNDKIYDLLNSRDQNKLNGLELRENKKGDNQIIDLASFEIKSLDQALEYLKLGLKNRITGSTHANAQSSRSHSIFQIEFSQFDRESNKIITSKLRIVDLAGSEKFILPKNITTEERELRIQELTSINGSLSTLGHCISALIEPNRTHIPFRNSKLTRVLSDSLGGNSKVCFIVCISPSTESATETFSTLQFANRAKKVILDGRHIKHQQQQQQQKLNAATSTLNKYNEFLEMLKIYCKDSKFSNQFAAVYSNNKIQELEDQVQELKNQNEEFKCQIEEIRRSCSPITRSTVSILNTSMSKPEAYSQNSFNSFLITKDTLPNLERDNEDISIENSTSKRRNKTFNSPWISDNYDSSQILIKKPSQIDKENEFIEDSFNKSKYDDEIDDDLRDMNEELNNSKNSILQKSSTKVQKLNNFGNETLDISNDKQKIEEIFSSFGNVQTPNKRDTIMLHRVKQKEIEAKYKMFFSKIGSNDTSPIEKEHMNQSMFNKSKSPAITRTKDDSFYKDKVGKDQCDSINTIKYTANDIKCFNDSESSHINPSINITDNYMGKSYIETCQSTSSNNSSNFSQQQTNQQHENDHTIIIGNTQLFTFDHNSQDKSSINSFYTNNNENFENYYKKGYGNISNSIMTDTSTKELNQMNESKSETSSTRSKLNNTLQMNLSKDKTNNSSKKILKNSNFLNSEHLDGSTNVHKDQKTLQEETLLKSLEKKLEKLNDINTNHDRLLKNLDKKLSSYNQKPIKELLDRSLVSNTSFEINEEEAKANTTVKNAIDTPDEFNNIISYLKKEVSIALNQAKQLKKLEPKKEAQQKKIDGEELKQVDGRNIEDEQLIKDEQKIEDGLKQGDEQKKGDKQKQKEGQKQGDRQKQEDGKRQGDMQTQDVEQKQEDGQTQEDEQIRISNIFGQKESLNLGLRNINCPKNTPHPSNASSIQENEKVLKEVSEPLKQKDINTSLICDINAKNGNIGKSSLNIMKQHLLTIASNLKAKQQLRYLNYISLSDLNLILC